MKTIVRNFLSVVRRFRVATLLNVVGLSVAFAAFIILMMQVLYDWGYDRSHTKADNVYRVGLIFPQQGNQVIHCRPFTEAFRNSSPHVREGGIFFFLSSEYAITVNRKEDKVSFTTQAFSVSPGYIRIFDFDLVEGKADALEIPGTVLIPESMARKLFEGEDAVGQQFTENGQPATIGGVYKDFPDNTIVRNGVYRGISQDQDLDNWQSRNYQFYLLLDNTKARDEIIANFKAHFHHEQYDWNTVDIRLTPLTDIHYETDALYDSVADKGSRTVVLILFTISLLIVAIAGINFTNFSNAIVPMRIKSINTQKVLGSSDCLLRWAIWIEAMLISLVSFLLSLILVRWVSFTWIGEMVSADMALEKHILLLLCTGVLAVLVGFLAGIYPARYITSFEPALVLKGSFGLSPSARKMRNALVGIQFVFSYVLVIAALFIYLQNRYMRTSPLGFDREQVVTVRLNGPLGSHARLLSNQLKNTSSVQDVSFADALLSGGDQYYTWGRGYRDEGIFFVPLTVTSNFLKLMNIPTMAGRDFRQEDAQTAGGAYIFNQMACAQYNMVAGEYITGNAGFETEPAVIAGFIDDIKFSSFRKEVSPMAFYVAPEKDFYAQYAYIKLKAGINMHEAVSSIHKTFASVTPDYPVEIVFYDTVLAHLYKREQSLGSLISLFSLIAVFISIVGVFGLVIFESEYRRKEIGLRKVHGALVSQILSMFNKTYIRILMICFVLAAPVAYYGVEKWLENFAYKVPLYGWVFAVAFVLVAFITLATVTFQNWHCANENPVKSIKCE